MADQRHTPSAALLRMKASALVLVGGKVKLIAPGLAGPRPRLQPLHVEGRGSVLVDANANALRATATKMLGEKIRLAGRRVLG